ncbi:MULTISPECIES: metallophosphoesterase [unclassified Rhizobium]|uniref:metallophosphoesterase n=1 Tax=unclassified Rhizobium TaxID=2613769 RepID=UPI001780AB63|nr:MULTISPECIES: metallophosphoesterase [unclassified Rhizobium]MBD8688169.1 serine/threonine protein phosphatase [Rhizobium sp. CFBP 13644]MBD8692624.1 serine/threonine protein phosphatase [Rhizobium sp. CFBP 13717]
MIKKFWSFFRRSNPNSFVAPARRRLDLGDSDPAYPIYAIGDIHGCMDLLEAGEEKIINDIRNTGRKGLVVTLGDYVDRGRKSSAVISHLSSPDVKPFRRIALCGNHDQAFLYAIEHPETIEEWLRFGGKETLLSYGIDIDHMRQRRQHMPLIIGRLLREAVPDEHINFLRNLPVSLKIGRYLFVHAGIRPGIALGDQSDEDLMWIREPFLSKGSGLPLTVIHGHTPSPAPFMSQSRIGIDTQAYSTGSLTILKIDGQNVCLL